MSWNDIILKQQIRSFAMSLLDDDYGINKEAYEKLCIILDALGIKIAYAIDSEEDRYFINSKF